jgi:hypothetical protein
VFDWGDKVLDTSWNGPGFMEREYESSVSFVLKGDNLMLKDASGWIPSVSYECSYNSDSGKAWLRH